ncbi:hypothetical protein MHYP_G00221470 [Metynnis hypsauchen]
MKLNPRQAPLYGSCVLTVQLSDEELCQGEEGREYAELFLVFTGSTQRHVSSTRRVSHDTLQAVCPAHECCESVVVTTCSADLGGFVRELASERISFVQDLAFDMAQFLVGAVGRADMLEDALLLDEHQIPLQECERMDQNLALALSHLTLPAGWSLLGNCNAPEPQETLLHFAARRGLQRVARFLLRQPGAQEALALPNKQGVTPASLAQSRGHSALLELFTQWYVLGREETSTQDSTETRRRISCSTGVVEHHPCLNTYTLSVGTQPGTEPRSLQADLQDFRCLIHHNTHGEGGAVLQLQSESPHTVGECADNPETRQACFEQPQHDSLDTREQESTSLCVKGNKNEHGGCCPGPLQHGDPAPPSDNSNRDEKRVCACENTEGDYGVQAESAAACVEGSRKEGDSGDCLQSTFGGESAAHQTSSCGKEGEETDRAQDLICEAQGTAEGPKREVQAEDCNSGRPAQDQLLEEDLLEHKAAAAGDMGITQSLDTPESSDVESGSQGPESDDEKEVNTDISSLELEEKAKGLVDLIPGVDQPLNTSHEKDGHDSNETDLNSTLQSLEDRHEFNASQVSCEQTSYELESDEQEKPGQDNIEGQEEESVSLCSNTEREISQEQAEATCHHGDTSKGTPEGRCLENETLEKIQASLEVETNEGEGMCISSGASPVTLNAVSNDSHLPEQETETGSEESRATGEPKVSRAAAGCESEEQRLGSSGDVSQPKFNLEPESPTPTSEDTLEPEEGCTTTNVSCSEQQGTPQPETPEDTPESQVLEIASEVTENKSSLRSSHCFEDRIEEITLQSGDVVNLCPLENPEIGISVSLEEQSNVELGSERSCKPAVVDTGSADIELTEAQDMQETEPERCEDAHTSALQKEKDVPLEDQVDCQTLTCPDVNTDNAVSMIHRERDSLCLDSSQASTHSRALEKRHSSESTESPRSQARHSTGSTTLRDSGSDTDGFISTDTGEDNVFRKAEETLGPGDSTSEASISCSSTDDTTSLGHPSSSAESSEEVRRGGGGGGGTGVGAGGETEEEAKDRLTEVPLRSSLLRTSVRSLSPFRRHSWGPGKNQGGEADMNQRSSVRSSGVQKPVFHRRSYSLEGLAAEQDDGKGWQPQGGGPSHGQRGVHRQQSEDRGSQVSLTEEGLESDLGDHRSLDSQKSRKYRPLRRSCPSMTLPLRQSVSMLSISQRDIDGMRSYSSTSSSLGYSITEEEPGPLRGDFEGKSGTKMSRTFSYLKNKMYKKTREKDKEKNREKDREAKEKEKKAVNGHLFSSATSVQIALCQHCNKALNAKDAVSCTSCSVCVHKSCRDNIPACTKGKFQKQQFLMPESTTMPGVTLRAKTSAPRERPWSAILSPDDHSLVITPRRHTSIMPFNSSNLSKSMSISNIAVFDEMSIKGLRYLSQSTDSLHKANKVNESTESLIDEGTEMIDGQLMGEFEADAKGLEADSWSFTMDKKYLKQLKKDVIKRQDVIYELIQTEMHHVRTLRIMADVYGKGLLKEVQLEPQTVEKVFPMLDDLLELHTVFFSSLLERKKEAMQENTDGGFVINRIGDVLVNQFSGSRAESMKKVYGKFCSRHNEAVNFYKELHAKDKRFQAFIKKKMSSNIVRRLGIPECILLVTQRITKYPVLMQRILQHTKENEEDYEDLSQALQLVKEVIAAVDSKVNEHEKKRRLKEIYNRTDGKSIMRMKSGQMFAREDLIRGRKLLHDGPLQLKSTAGRLKDVQAVLLSDVLVFLQEKDQKYVFASLDQRATVISLQKLIVREVANEDRGLFLITAGIERPEMVEVHASSREERNTWMQLIQDAMHSIEKDDDEGIPSETEEDKKLLESKAREMRDMLRRKDDQILTLLQEKIKLFHDMCECTSPDEKMLFRACNDDVPRGEPIMKEAIKEVEMLQTLVNSSLGGAVGQQVVSAPGSTVSVCLPRRAETFGGFDSHQMNISKHGDKEEGEDLRRTESDGVLKKGGNTNLLLLLKRNSEQVLSSVTHLHDLLSSLQAVVVQQDTFIEDQRQSLSERPSSRPSSRPPSLVEQEKQRSLERHRQEAAALQRQQAAHAEERKRREREWDAREKELVDRESVLNSKEDEVQRRRRELEESRRELQGRKEDYQKDLERLRDSQRKLEREKEQMQREMEKLEYIRETEKRVNRTPSSTSEDSLNIQSSSSVERDLGEPELSASPRKNSLSRMDSKHKGRNLNPFSLGPKAVSTDGHKQVQNRLLQLAKTKDKKDKKKKKSKSKPSQEAESHLLPLTEPPLDGEIFFC